MHAYRTHTCAALTADAVGQTVRLSGWVHRKRDHGGVLFVDLRDHYGITQIVAKAGESAHDALGAVRSEWVIKVTGTVRERSNETVNQKLPTGGIEVAATTVEVINEAKTPPFYVNEETPVDENLRWKYRYIDLRRECPKDLIRLRHDVVAFIRHHLTSRVFCVIETPTLILSYPP